jgi:hypothetical protein
LRATIATARFVTQAVAVKAHQRRFRSGKKGGQQKQQNKQPEQGRQWNLIAQ